MKTEINAGWPSVNRHVQPLVEWLEQDALALRLYTVQLENGSLLLDAGIHAAGGIEAGRRIAEICLGGLGQVSLQSSSIIAAWPWQLVVHTANPVLACLGSQYAGWSLSHGTGKEAFRALGSGPARALAVKEELFQQLAYRDTAEAGCLVLETDRMPPLALVNKIVNDCRISPEKLTLILTPTQSLAGSVQIAARIVEVALHKLHAIGYPLEQVIDATGCVPLPPPADDFLTAMGRTNDTILFGGQVHLFVTGTDSDAQDLAAQLPSDQSRDYGKPFAQVFKEYQYDFYQIDPLLFAPAQVTVTSLKSGRSYMAGRLNQKLLAQSFGISHDD